MLYIIGGIVLLCITFLLLNRYFEGMSVFCGMAAFISCAALLSVLFVWGVNSAEARQDYAYMELWLSQNDASECIADTRFAELYIKYKAENAYWISRQFTGKPPVAVQGLFDSGGAVGFTIQGK